MIDFSKCDRSVCVRLQVQLGAKLAELCNDPSRAVERERTKADLEGCQARLRELKETKLNNAWRGSKGAQ